MISLAITLLLISISYYYINYSFIFFYYCVPSFSLISIATYIYSEFYESFILITVISYAYLLMLSKILFSRLLFCSDNYFYLRVSFYYSKLLSFFSSNMINLEFTSIYWILSWDVQSEHTLCDLSRCGLFMGWVGLLYLLF